jgi:hypothetical protein
MTEKLLQFIWQFQYFNTTELQTEDGEHLQIIKPGLFNHNQGPDFIEAAVKINQLTFVGNVELHVNTSDWDKHQHASDKNYSNIILHVVWNNDKKENNSIPVLVLQNRIAKVLLQRYEQLMNNVSFIACENYISSINTIVFESWKERLMIERLEQKSKKIFQLLFESNNHWEEVLWQMLAYNFGIKINAELFEEVAKTISVNILAKHKNQIHQLEALLLGQANLLNHDFEEDYPNLLKREYNFLRKKCSLKPVQIQPHFLRMRPANFPTIRLAQLAMLVHKSSHLFSVIKELSDVKQIKQLFNITCNDYWHYHYTFIEATDYKPKNLGNQMTENIIINTIIPVLFAYGLYIKEQSYKDKALAWLTELSAEKNKIIAQWQSLNITISNAFDSQSLIHLTNNYCKQKKCLQCAVGSKVLSNKF